MSSNRILILAAVAIVELFAISLAISLTSDDDASVEPTNWWVNLMSNLLGGDQELELSEVLPREGTLTATDHSIAWTLSNNVSKASLEILRSKSKRGIRNVNLSLEQGGPCYVSFMPRRGAKDTNKFADPQAIPITSTNFKTDAPALKLTILEYGGTLVVTQRSGPVIFRLD